MSRDDGLLSGAEIDAFVLGAADDNGRRRDGDMGTRARQILRDRLVGRRMEDEA